MEIPSKGTHGLREVGLSMSTAVIQVPFELVQKWQEIVDVIAEIIHVPSALVMKVEPPNIKVFVSSVSNGNPYERDEIIRRKSAQFSVALSRSYAEDLASIRSPWFA